MIKYEARVTKVTVLPMGVELFDAAATDVEIEDEAAGEYVVVTQDYEDSHSHKIRIDPTEWAILRKTINRLMREIAKHATKDGSDE